MANVIKLKTGTSTPTTSNLVDKEVAIDTSAQKFYVRDDTSIKEIGGISDVVADTTPQLGGALDVQAQEINTSTSNGNIKLAPNGTGLLEVKGNTNAGTIQLNCENNSHGVKIKGPPHSASASYTLTLPNDDGSADQVLKTDGSGVLSWVDQSGGGGGSGDKISEGNTEVETVDTGTDGHIKFTTEGVEHLRIDNGGKLLVGHTAAYGSGKAQIHNTSQYLFDLNIWSADANPAVLTFYKSRNATPGSATIVQDDDGIGSLRFLGNDGTNSREAAYIKSFVDGTPGTDDMPGRIVFGTTADDGSSATERLRITSTGAWAIEGASNYGTSGQVLTSNGDDSPTWQNASGGGGSSTLAGLTDVTISSASNGQVLKYNGSGWVNDTDATGSGGGGGGISTGKAIAMAMVFG